MKSYIQQKSKKNKVNPLPGKKNLQWNTDVTVIGPQAPEQMLKAARGCLIWALEFIRFHFRVYPTPFIYDTCR